MQDFQEGAHRFLDALFVATFDRLAKPDSLADFFILFSSVGPEESAEKGIKKTVCAFLKILHPSGMPTDEIGRAHV